ncbi:Clp protease N-terminal domain-containing protein [Amycolatopsis rhabdoformis]|uniref:Clp protease N-terminal domain-containing protein n=1 Tax=Amycolatopsis rhabdoformis TaxID=1448059 RepID=A0ABZ1IBS2_9PSEU|nr:Clp protease N-terminal domain-containing protein [Amycolatopsis rhabdoformis]WSE31573.1 Clp protease N-terminal domain-containing protein [Amycolatopsis rhabdoformis]
MFERFTPEARTVVVHAQEHARRLGHRSVGCEHLLLAVSSTDQPAADVLRERGITPDRVEEEIVRRVGLGGLFQDLDGDALAAVGIDLDAVRARIVASFGADALAEAANAVHRAPRPSRLSLRRAIPPRLWRRRPRLVHALAPPATGRYRAETVSPGHLPFTARAKKSLENSVHEAQALHEQNIGVEHLALGLVRMTDGLVAEILPAFDVSGPVLHAEILARYRRAG